MAPLWTSAEIAAATGGAAAAPFAAGGVAFDSREVGPGDLFVALKGEAADGHRFVQQALAQGAAGVLVSDAVEGPHVRVADTARALDALGVAARARVAGTVIGVTGSVGKTSVKEALFAALDRTAPGRAHRSLKSYNNHVGVPLSVARMPRETRFGVFEMGMNHAGELAALTRLVRPQVALVTTVALAHGAFFADEAAIADAKGEIFQGLEPGGTAIIPYDSPHRDRLIAAARPYAGEIVTFGRSREADVHAREGIPGPRGTFVQARLRGGEVSFTLAPPGDHWITNALAVLAVVEAGGGDLAAAGLALADLAGLPGRGRRIRVTLPGGGEALLIDEAYKANPASMRATLHMLGQEPGGRVAILGSMRELGPDEARHHAELATPVEEAGVRAALLV
ncbi:UDP-N-acetylmuramoyl-tripeptide--D-alanyl-D-alanine ligase, partial [Sphingomonas sp.]|uniref:UDP-N-acetylmuramoyl-tripeptide--D-alanyl-D- alanine ligase n=1 Tax=Sphingomonas sp. TaxID=28214 RepID=UPI003B3A5EEF